MPAQADLLAQFPPDTRFSLSAGPDEELTIGMQLELDGLGGAPTTQQALILALKQALKLQVRSYDVVLGCKAAGDSSRACVGH